MGAYVHTCVKYVCACVHIHIPISAHPRGVKRANSHRETYVRDMHEPLDRLGFCSVILLQRFIFPPSTHCGEKGYSLPFSLR